jgi:hypothetical protein
MAIFSLLFVGCDSSSDSSVEPTIEFKIGDIPSQTIEFEGQFTNITLSDFIENGVGEISWSVEGSEKIDVAFNAQVASFTRVDPLWFGSEDITFKAIDSEDNEVSTTTTFTVKERESRTYIINGSGDFGSFSIIKDQSINNGVESVGKWPNDLVLNSDKLYVVNSGNSDIRIYSEGDLTPLGAVMVSEGSNPMNCEIFGNKLYVTSLYGTSVEVYNLDNNSLITNIPLNGGSNGADVVAKNGNYLYVNRNNYSFGKATYDNEVILKVDTTTDMVVDSVEVGVNVASLIFDNSGKLHAVCGGNYGDIKGEINIIDVDDMSVVHKINFDFQINCSAIDEDGYIYTAKTDYDEDWNPESAILKYNPTTYEIINGDDNPIYSTESGIMDIDFDIYTEKLYVPLFHNNSVKVFKDDTEVESYTTGEGPLQILCR